MKRKLPHAGRDGVIDWDRQQRLNVEFAKFMMLNHGEIAPMYIIHMPHYTKAMPGTWSDDRQKAIMQRMIALMAASEGAVGITFIAEAWVRSVHPLPGENEAATRARAITLRPADYEDREEIVAITTEFRTAAGRQTAATFLDIVRDTKGAVTAVPLRDTVGATYEPGVQMLADQPLTEEQKEFAARAFKQISEVVGLKVETRNIHPAGHA